MRIFKKVVMAVGTLGLASFLGGCGNTTTVELYSMLPDETPASGYVLDVRLQTSANKEEFQQAFKDKATDEDKKFTSCHTTTDAKGYAVCELLDSVDGEKATMYEVRAIKYSAEEGKEAVIVKNMQSSFNLQNSWIITVRLSDVK